MTAQVYTVSETPGPGLERGPDGFYRTPAQVAIPGVKPAGFFQLRWQAIFGDNPHIEAPDFSGDVSDLWEHPTAMSDFHVMYESDINGPAPICLG